MIQVRLVDGAGLPDCGTTRERSARATQPERPAGVSTSAKSWYSVRTVTVSPSRNLNAGSAPETGEVRAGASRTMTTASFLR